MASLFKRYRSKEFVPQFTDSEWDAIKTSIRANKREIDDELVGIALAFLATQPGFANLVPVLSSAYGGVQPSNDLGSIVQLVQDTLGAFRD